MDYKLLIDKAINAGFSDFEAYITNTESMNLMLFNGEIDKSSANISHVVTLRGIYQEKMVSYTLEDEDTNIQELIAKMIDNATVITAPEKNEIFAGSESYPTLEKIESGYKTTPSNVKIEMLKNVEKIAKGLDERIVILPHCSYSDVSTTVKIVNSKGLDLSKSIEYGMIALQAVAKEGESTQDGFEVKIALKYDELNAEAIAKKAVTKAISMLGADAVPSKTYPVIIENEAMCDILNGFSSMFCGDAAMKKLSPLTDKVNEKIMGEEVNIIDDPLLPNAVNSQPFDDEGVACYKKTVVEKGVFKLFLHNLKSAKFFNATTTGNGVKGNDIVVSPINLYIEPGVKSKEQLIKETKEGLLLTDLSGLHASLNPVSGDFSAQASGYFIENGVITKPVTLVVVSSNFLKMMSQIDSIGSDLFVGYDGVGAPSIKFKGLPISGK